MKAAAKELNGLIPKSLADAMSNQDADVWFDDYCNHVRDKLKLQRV